MFQINDDVMHKTAGACIVSDIVTKDFGNGEKQYYCLRPKYPTHVNKSLEIYLPLDSDNVVIRKPSSKTEVMALLNSFSFIEVIWNNDSKLRKLKFEEVYQSGDLKQYCQLVKLLYIDESFFIKPLSLTDKVFINKVKNILFDEFAIALKVLPEEIDAYIRKYLN